MKSLARSAAYKALDLITGGRGVPRVIGGETFRMPARWSRYHDAGYEPGTFALPAAAVSARRHGHGHRGPHRPVHGVHGASRRAIGPRPELRTDPVHLRRPPRDGPHQRLRVDRGGEPEGRVRPGGARPLLRHGRPHLERQQPRPDRPGPRGPSPSRPWASTRSSPRAEGRAPEDRRRGRRAGRPAGRRPDDRAEPAGGPPEPPPAPDPGVGRVAPGGLGPPAARTAWSPRSTGPRSPRSSFCGRTDLFDAHVTAGGGAGRDRRIGPRGIHSPAAQLNLKYMIDHQIDIRVGDVRRAAGGRPGDAPRCPPDPTGRGLARARPGRALGLPRAALLPDLARREGPLQADGPGCRMGDPPAPPDDGRLHHLLRTPGRDRVEDGGRALSDLRLLRGCSPGCSSRTR